MLTEIKIKELQRISCQSPNKKNNVTPSKSTTINEKRSPSNIEVVNKTKQTNNFLNVNNVNVNIYGQDKKYVVNNLKMTSERKLIINKKETVHSKKEVIENSGNKLSNYLLKNNNLNACNIQRIIPRELETNVVTYAMSNVRTPQRESNPIEHSPYNIRIPGEGKRSQNGTRNVSVAEFPQSVKSVSPITFTRNKFMETSPNVPNNNRNFFNREPPSLIQDNEDFIENEDFRKEIIHTVGVSPQRIIDFDFDNVAFTHNNPQQDQSLLSLNKDLSKGKGGKIEFQLRSPFKTKPNHIPTNFKIHTQKITLLQSVFRGHVLRAKLYHTLYNYYTGIAFISRLKKFKRIMKKNIFTQFFENLKILDEFKDKKENLSFGNELNPHDVHFDLSGSFHNKKLKQEKINHFENCVPSSNETFSYLREAIKQEDQDQTKIVDKQENDFDLESLKNKIVSELTIKDISNELKKEILLEYINENFKKFEICNDNTYFLNSKIEEAPKIDEFFKFITTFNEKLSISKNYDFNLLSPSLKKEKVFLEICQNIEINHIISKKNKIFEISPNIQNSYITLINKIEVKTLILSKNEEFQILNREKVEKEKNISHNNIIPVTPPKLPDIKLKEETVDEKNEKIKKRLNEALEKKLNKGTTPKTPQNEEENKVPGQIGYKQSNKILRIAKLLEDKLATDDPPEPKLKDDSYTQILLNKPVSSKQKKKPKNVNFQSDH